MDRLHKSLILLCITGIVLTGCRTSSGSQSDDCYPQTPGRLIVCDKQRGYMYWQPEWIFLTDWRKRDVDVSTYDYPLFADEKKRGLEEKVLNCSTSITGVSKTISLLNANGNAEWGRVDVWDHLDLESGDNPYEGLRNVVCKADGLPTATSIYALCSEKNGRTVVICIPQITDDEKLAREIFETFRWTK